MDIKHTCINIIFINYLSPVLWQVSEGELGGWARHVRAVQRVAVVLSTRAVHAQLLHGDRTLDVDTLDDVTIQHTLKEVFFKIFVWFIMTIMSTIIYSVTLF